MAVVRREHAEDMRKPLGYLLAAWSFSFAVVHVAWALGWRAGLEADMPPITDRPWFLTYDLVAAMLMFLAAAVAVLLARGGLDRRTRDRLVVLTLVGSVLALGRGLPALVWDVTTDTYGFVSFGADVWFTVAGAVGLGLASLARERRTAPNGELARY